MKMYDPLETDISYEYLIKLKDKATGLRFGIIGGWGVFFHVNEEYKRAFGRDYLKSRDIDVFIGSNDEEKFDKVIADMEFKPSSYNFRYELIYDRTEKVIIPLEKAKKKHIFDLIYVFLDVFSDKKTKTVGSWVFPHLSKAKIENISNCPVLDINALIDLKATSFFEREKLDKELKDACDIYALLFYSAYKIKPNIVIKKAIEKLVSRLDLQEYIAENVLGDSLKVGLVK